jgi:hypothetical protein
MVRLAPRVKQAFHRRPWAVVLALALRLLFHGSAGLRCFLGGCRTLAFVRDQRDCGTDLYPVRALGDQDLGNGAFVDRLELHRCLVGLDFGKEVARL